LDWFFLIYPQRWPLGSSSGHLLFLGLNWKIVSSWLHNAMNDLINYPLLIDFDLFLDHWLFWKTLDLNQFIFCHFCNLQFDPSSLCVDFIFLWRIFGSGILFFNWRCWFLTELLFVMCPFHWLHNHDFHLFLFSSNVWYFRFICKMINFKLP